ncbi:unnamed protein product [Discosporangium mesarthrocarpum]
MVHAIGWVYLGLGGATPLLMGVAVEGATSRRTGTFIPPLPRSTWLPLASPVQTHWTTHTRRKLATACGNERRKDRWSLFSMVSAAEGRTKEGKEGLQRGGRLPNSKSSTPTSIPAPTPTPVQLTNHASAAGNEISIGKTSEENAKAGVGHSDLPTNSGIRTVPSAPSLSQAIRSANQKIEGSVNEGVGDGSDGRTSSVGIGSTAGAAAPNKKDEEENGENYGVHGWYSPVTSGKGSSFFGSVAVGDDVTMDASQGGSSNVEMEAGGDNSGVKKSTPSIPYAIASSTTPSKVENGGDRADATSGDVTLNSSKHHDHGSETSERRRLLENWEVHDEVWISMREEAKQAAEEEPLMVSFIYSTIINQKSLEAAVAFHLANKLAGPNMLSTQVQALVRECFNDETNRFRRQLRRDIIAVRERDPACQSYHDALLYFKGFQALQTHRVAHWLYNSGRHTLAFYLQSQVNQEFQIDIHPAAQFGEGVFIDHGTGIVVGETAVVGNDVSMLHRVTLGGSGVRHGQRHPKIGNGVLIGAGACLLGNIKVGAGTQIGAGSLVVEDLPERCVAVGVPAKVLGQGRLKKPALSMEQDFFKEVYKGINI